LRKINRLKDKSPKYSDVLGGFNLLQNKRATNHRNGMLLLFMIINLFRKFLLYHRFFCFNAVNFFIAANYICVAVFIATAVSNVKLFVSAGTVSVA